MKQRYSDWLSNNIFAAEKVTAGTGIFPEVLLSQAIIESAKNGKMPGTMLAAKHNNYFGIKAGKSWKGATVNMKTGEFTKAGDYYTMADSFRKYNSPAESFADYVKLLHNKRYAAALEATTPRAQAAALQAAGYSTNPDYSKIVSALAESIKNAGSALKKTVSTTAGAGAAALATLAGIMFYVTTKSKHGR